MDKIYIPSHKDGDNRGCEAITKGTAQILKVSPEKLIAFSENYELDHALKLNDYVTLQDISTAMHPSSLRCGLYRIRRAFLRTSELRRIYGHGCKYIPLLREIQKQDLALSTGGDMFCYENNEVIFINNYLHRRGVPTVLWGCSVGKDNLTPEKIDTLKKFSLITVRESLSEEALRSLGLQNVQCFPDPAFVLAPEKCCLSDCFQQDQPVIGINLSNYILGKEPGNSLGRKNVFNMIQWLLKNTDFNILLIPHVLWKGQDDRTICNEIFQHFRDSQRIFQLDTEKYNYCQIRYVISKCRFFVGARTHSIISAYSMQVPALALGYSIKSIGIAKDLGLDPRLVCDSRHYEHEQALADAVAYLIENEESIRAQYRKILPEYIQKAYLAGDAVENLHIS